MAVRQSVRPNRNNSTIIGQMSRKLYLGNFKNVEALRVSLNSDTDNGDFT